MTEYELGVLMAAVDELEEAAEVLEKESRHVTTHSRFMAGLSSGMLAGADLLLKALKEIDANRSQRLSAEAVESMYQYYNMVTMEEEFRND